MKTQFKVLGALMMIAFITGCQPAKDGASVRTSTSPRSDGTVSTASADNIKANGLNGLVYTSSGNQSVFNDLASSFMEASYPKSSIGYVSAVAAIVNGHQTGVFFGAQVPMQSGVFHASGGANGYVSSTNSKVVIQVLDYVDSQTTLSPLAPVQMGRVAQGSYVNGTSADIMFYDDYGTVEFKGTFDANNFTGVFSFATTQKYDHSGAGDSGTMGNFSIPTCKFFVCQ